MTVQATHDITEESALIKCINKNDLSAFSSLYDKYSNVLYGIIYGVTGNVALSEDLLQKTFCAIWQGIKTRDASRQRFLTWMICIARNLAHQSLSADEQKIHPTNNFVNDQKQVNFT